MRFRASLIACAAVALVAGEASSAVPNRDIDAGSLGAVWYHGRELLPPWFFSFDREDTLRLNGEAIEPQPVRPDPATARPDSASQRRSDRREECIRAALDAFDRDQSVQTYERVIRQCAGELLASVKIRRTHGEVSAILHWTDLSIDCRVPLVGGLRSNWHTVWAPGRSQRDFIEHFQDFMTKPDRCVVIGRGWDLWTREHPGALRAAVSRFKSLPRFRPGIDDTLLGVPSSYSAIRNRSFQEDLRKAR